MFALQALGKRGRLFVDEFPVEHAERLGRYGRRVTDGAQLESVSA